MRRLALLAAAGLLGLGACNKDPNTTKLQYVPDMADAPTVKTLRDYMEPPEGTVAMNSYPYPKTVEDAERTLQMPQRIAMDPDPSEGKVMYDTYCAVCHGVDAKGQGTVTPPFPQPPDLTHESYLARRDGFYFHVITFGSAIMPSYGHAVTVAERWHIVKYLRTLQGAGK